MSHNHSARPRDTPACLVPGGMRNRPYSTSAGHASGRSSHHDMVARRHSAAPSSRPRRPVAPPAWVDDNFDSDQVQGEQRSYFSGYGRQQPETVIEEQPQEPMRSRRSTHSGRVSPPQPSRQRTRLGSDSPRCVRLPPRGPASWRACYVGARTSRLSGGGTPLLVLVVLLRQMGCIVDRPAEASLLSPRGVGLGTPGTKTSPMCKQSGTMEQRAVLTTGPVTGK
ncbi:hypothetical protein PG985_013569 [Apiospora marii]|uniref:uncharacterized protein n=1 Tax=Apiospora marii TaxID=335849 RepID=UPI00312FA08E